MGVHIRWGVRHLTSAPASLGPGVTWLVSHRIGVFSYSRGFGPPASGSLFGLKKQRPIRWQPCGTQYLARAQRSG